MALSMARPWKHPKTGIYWLRKYVPPELRAKVGKREEKRSLGTRDPAEAKRAHLQALVELEARWANLRQGPRSLSEREAHELAQPVHDWWLETHKDNPSEQVEWSTEIGGRLWPPPKPFDLNVPLADAMAADFADDLKRYPLEKWCLTKADELLQSRGLIVDEDSRLRLAKAVAAAMQRASLTLERMARGEPLAIAFPFSSAPKPTVVRTGQMPVSFDDLVKGWASESRPAEKTDYEWKRVIGQLSKFLKHGDASRLTPEDVIAWKAAMVEEGLQPKTIRDAKLAPVRAILQWGVENKKLPSNPAQGVSIDVKAKPSLSRRSFNDKEAATILAAARGEKNPVKRWVPWLCAYSGARVSEVCQLRAADVIQQEGIWCIKFDPEAGPLKTVSSERIIPLHSAVIEAGFLDFVKTIKSGPLFSKLPPNRFGSRGGNGTKVIGRWVRSLGLTDPRLSPNHSWRHRIKTLARKHGLALDIVDAITGHRRKTVADGYGEFPVDALSRELKKIPPVLIE